MSDALDLAKSHIHLGLGATATVLPNFEWSEDALAEYDRRFAADGDDGRLVTMGAIDADWSIWERHPAGEEVVVLVSGRADMVQWIDGAEHVVPMRQGQAMVNPTGVWHTARVHEPGTALFITPGRGTEHVALDELAG